MNCINCGGALRPASAVCPYCNTLNDIDLRGIFDVARRAPDHLRHCPRCTTSLESLDLGLGTAFLLDRCPQCLGLFFDPSELDQIVKQTIGEPARVDLVRLNEMLERESPAQRPAIQYVRCPTCGVLMNRRSYGVRCGVILDECRPHGVWLDGGELRRILQWVRAGGLEHQRQREEERRRTEAQPSRLVHFREDRDTDLHEATEWDIGGMIASIASLLRRLLR